MEANAIILIVSLAINIIFITGKTLSYRKRLKEEKKRDGTFTYPLSHTTSERYRNNIFGLIEDNCKKISDELQFDINEIVERNYKERDDSDLEYDLENYIIEMRADNEVNIVRAKDSGIEDLSPETLRRNFKAAINSENYEEAGNIKSLADERGINLES